MRTRRTYSLMLLRFLVRLKQIEGSSTGHEQQRTKLELTLLSDVCLQAEPSPVQTGVGISAPLKIPGPTRRASYRLRGYDKDEQEYHTS